MKSWNSKFKITILTIGFFVFFPMVSLGAKLYLEPAQGEYHQSDIFIVELRIEVDECINLVKADLSFSEDNLEIVDFSRGESILTLWINPPFIDQEKGLISFIGGVPGGYCGKIQGDPGPSNLLGRAIFRVKDIPFQGLEEKRATINFLDTSEVFLNDGLGTKSELFLKGASFKILTKSASPKDEWQEELRKDTFPPEPFEIEIRREPTVFEGKYFIIFSATDKQSGIDHYEIKEGQREWREAVSPYLLEDQTLEGTIKVMAVDMAGNKRIQEISPKKEEIERKVKRKDWKRILFWLMLVLIGGMIWWAIRKLKIKIRRLK